MTFWILYLLLSALLCFLISYHIKNRIVKALVFSFSLACFSTVWFISPEKNTLAPAFSIFLIESTISESNGLMRIFRPFILIFVIYFLLSLAVFRKN